MINQMNKKDNNNLRSNYYIHCLKFLSFQIFEFLNKWFFYNLNNLKL